VIPEESSARLGPVPLLLVRHAHARARKDWTGDELARPLTNQGQRQAQGLVSVVSRFGGPSLVVSSPSLRCLQTVAPLAARFEIGVEQDPSVAEGESVKAVNLVRHLASQGTTPVVCTHGDVIVEILVALADEDRVDLGPRPKQAKGSVWALEAIDGRFVSAQYFAPVISGGD
jgi:8-oxo-(d)GTP phosphatase